MLQYNKFNSNTTTTTTTTNNNNNNSVPILLLVLVTPIIIGATGTNVKLRQYLSNVLGKHEIKELQKKQPYCTHTAGSANAKEAKVHKTYFTDETTLHAAQTVNTEQLQHYLP